MWALTSITLAAACAGESGSWDEVEVGDHTVVIRMTDDLRFVPENLAISVGDTVVRIIEGALPHTSTDKPGNAGVDEHNILPQGRPRVADRPSMARGAGDGRVHVVMEPPITGPFFLGVGRDEL